MKPESSIQAWACEPNWKSGATVHDRFMELCIPEPNSGCWLWLGNIERETKPYGRMDISGKTSLAHRVSYKIFIGAVDPDILVCHKCDNPMCVNPDHLFLGTPKDNSADRDRKGRHAFGDKSGKRKLTLETVLQIRGAEGTCREIGRRFGVDNTYISRIKRGAPWEAAIRNRGKP